MCVGGGGDSGGDDDDVDDDNGDGAGSGMPNPYQHWRHISQQLLNNDNGGYLGSPWRCWSLNANLIVTDISAWYEP